MFRFNLSAAAAHLSSFNELATSYQDSLIRQQKLMHNLFTEKRL